MDEFLNKEYIHGVDLECYVKIYHPVFGVCYEKCIYEPEPEVDEDDGYPTEAQLNRIAQSIPQQIEKGTDISQWDTI